MQLSSPRTKCRIAKTLGLLAANLLAAHAAQAAAAAGGVAQDSGAIDQPGSLMTVPADGPGTTVIDSAVLFYQEQGGRVQAIEPTSSITINRSNGDVFSAKYTYDSLTGATPNGAMPWTSAQTFTTPSRGSAHSSGAQQTVTSASGTVVTNPTTGQAISQYMTPANTLPVDKGFRDRRYAGELDYSWAYNSNTRISAGGAISFERDYRSYSGNVGMSRDLNDKNTTLSINANFEYDQSRPFFGTPTPLTPMNGDRKGPNDKKTVVSVVAGLTQVLSRHWLVQLNYSFGSNQGYQADPYRILSVVDVTTGAPLEYLYESRPRSRTRQSVYVGSKLSVGPTVADLSGRFYHDSWGIDSITAEVAEQIPVTHALYIQPGFRYYRQSAANFFRYYLLDGSPLPQFASSDSRLSKFQSRTFDLKMGVKVFEGGEFYVLGEDYKQMGASHLANAAGALSGENLFSGVHARSVMAGLRFSVS